MIFSNIDDQDRDERPRNYLFINKLNIAVSIETNCALPLTVTKI